MIAHLEFLEGSGARLGRWGIAAALMVSLHAGAAALAVVNWPEDDTVAEPSGSFMVELSPMPVAPPAEKLNLAIGVRSDEAAPSVTPTGEVTEKSEVETEKVEPSPLAPAPEVVLPKPRPIEEKDEKVEEEDPRPEQKAVTTTSAASQEMSAPPPVEAPPAPIAAAPRAGVPAKPSEAAMSWHKSLVYHLNHHKKYPHEARRNGAQGVVSVSFTIDRSGKVIRTRLDKSSGNDLLDEEAIAVLNRASPFPAPPPDVPNLTINLELPIQFRIRH